MYSLKMEGLSPAQARVAAKNLGIIEQIDPVDEKATTLWGLNLFVSASTAQSSYSGLVREVFYHRLLINGDVRIQTFKKRQYMA